MKILRLQASNIKRLRAIDITPNPADPLVIIGGANGEGKSSALDAIMYALAGGKTLPAVPIRRGADEAEVAVDLGDYRVTMRIAGGRRTLTVTDADGKKPAGGGPQAILDGLYSALTFAPLAFARDEPKRQLATLRKLVGLDFTVMDAERKRLYDERTAVNRSLASVSERFTAIPLDVLKAPDVEVNIGELVNQRSRAATQNQRRLDHLANIERLFRHVESLKSELLTAELQLAEAREEIEAEVSTAELDAAISTAQDTNRAVQAKATWRKLSTEAKELERKAADMTKAIEVIDAEKVKRMAEAPWPVPGLGFAEDGVLLNGLPFEQASSAEQLRVSLAIGAALNPTLRVLLDRDGSLLDDRSMAIVREFAAKNDMQVWLERVGTGDAGAIIIEDGEVAGLSDEA